jgi:hypothetical protein
MNEPVLSATAGYAENAAALIEQYERLTFEEVHREVLSLFRSGPVVFWILVPAPAAMRRHLLHVVTW